jgi:hypothetical protein
VRKRKVYYWVFGLQDGTIWAVGVNRKPRKTQSHRAPRIDEDGIYRWTIYKDVVPANLPEWERALWHATIATRLNVKRALGEQVEPQIAELKRQQEAIANALIRVEEKLGRLLSGVHEHQDPATAR